MIGLSLRYIKYFKINYYNNHKLNKRGIIIHTKLNINTKETF